MPRVTSRRSAGNAYFRPCNKNSSSARDIGLVFHLGDRQKTLSSEPPGWRFMIPFYIRDSRMESGVLERLKANGMRKYTDPRVYPYI
jgi:hypothetical protein